MILTGPAGSRGPRGAAVVQRATACEIAITRAARAAHQRDSARSNAMMYFKLRRR
jgi:hypothetical protein